MGARRSQVRPKRRAVARSVIFISDLQAPPGPPEPRDRTLDGRLMRRLPLSPLNVMLVLMLAAVVPQQAFGPPRSSRPRPAAQAPPRPHRPDTARPLPGAGGVRSHAVGGIAAAAQPDQHRHRSRRAHLGGRRRSLPLPLTPASPKAIASSCCRTPTATARPTARTPSCRSPALIAPLGVSVIDNKIIVSQPPDLIVYTDVDRNLRFDPAVDKREVLLTGFQGINHDHSLHSVTVGPDGKWIFNSGNTGGMFTDKSGKTFRIFGSYRPGPVGPFKFPNDPAVYAGKPSDDGHVYVGGFTVRMNPDGTNAEIIGSNYRNSYEQSVTSLGDVFQNDNDDPPACRVSWVMEYANFGFSSNDGQRTLAGGPPARPVGSGRGVAPGRSGHDAGRRRLRRRIADRQRLLRERRARAVVGRDVLRGRRRAQRGLLLPAGARRARASRSTARSS